jgi:chromosome segregation protein
MKLSKLHLQGFKSFRDKTTIYFDDGITGIVGPNGCGKSNIVDALFWVMGEQSAKHLRGKSMKDLIFAGSDKYSPASFAEVTLVLENVNGKHIHIANQVVKPNEIQIARKLYRNGETEYRINGLPARLKDIQEVFMDTGAGAKSYSIIAQGEINRLVQAKPVERRTMIEEVAGITKFKKRKHESMRKIDQTQTNLGRLNDLQSEIYKNLKALERQAEKAERAKNLKEKIRKFDLVVESHKEFNYLKDFSEGQDFLAKNKTLLSELIGDKEKLELTLADERIKRTELTEQVDASQKEYNEKSRELAGLEQKLNYLQKNKEEKTAYLEEKREELSNLRSEILVTEQKLAEANKEKEQIQSESHNDDEFNELQEKLNTLKEQSSSKEQLLISQREQEEQLRDSLQDEEQLSYRLENKLIETSNALEDIASEMEVLEGQSSMFSGDLAREKEALQKASELFESLDTKAQEMKSELSGLTEQERELQAIVRELSQSHMKKDSRRQSLEEINRNLQSSLEGANQYLETSNDENTQILSSLIECEKEYEGAVESLISQLNQSLISSQFNSNSFASWLREAGETQLELIKIGSSNSITDESLERLQVNGLEGIKKFNEVIRVTDSKYESAIHKLFSGYLIVENLDADIALNLSTDLSFDAMTSNDGSVVVKKINSNLQVSFKKKEELSEGVVQRNNEINELTQEVEQIQTQLTEKESELNEVSQKLIAIQADYDKVREELTSAHQDYITKKTSLESKEQGFESSRARLEILKNRKAEVSAQRIELLEQEEKNKKILSNASGEMDSLRAQLSQTKEAFAALKEELDAESQAFIDQEVRMRTFESRVQANEEKVQSLTESLEKSQIRIESITEQITSLSTETESMDEQIETQAKENASLVDVVQVKENSLNNEKAELNDLVAGMQSRESEVKDIANKINKIEKSLIEKEVKINQIIEDEELVVRNNFEKYQIDLRSVITDYLELNADQVEPLRDISSVFVMETEDGPEQIMKRDYHFDRKYGQQLRDYRDRLKQFQRELNRLGEINYQAIEDYNHQKVRYDFLKEQEVELKKSLHDLETAIKHIDDKSKVRFKEAFADVDDKFQKVFPIIFGGGNARLHITSSLDDPECGIDIIAQPPGKKMQNINLMSGGEKALTAVSLIFSIFLVKPSPFCLLDEVDAPLDDANVGRFNELLREMSSESQFILITHNKKTMELNDTLYGVTMQEPGISKAMSVQLQ